MSTELNKLLQSVTSDVTTKYSYEPEDYHKKAKSAFWSAITESGVVVPPGPLSVDLVAQYVSDTRLVAWWSVPGFQEWFSNSQEFQQRADFIAQLALDELENIIRSNLVTAQVKGPLIKLAFELSGKLTSKKAEAESEDDVISRMSKSELEEYIAKKMPVLVTTKKKKTDGDAS